MSKEIILMPDGTVTEKQLTGEEVAAMASRAPVPLWAQLQPLFPNSGQQGFDQFPVTLRRKYLLHKWEIKQHLRSEDTEALLSLLNEMKADTDYAGFVSLIDQVIGIVESY